jgi:CO/xanthine dehydrogenase Mo-binding subunit
VEKVLERVAERMNWDKPFARGDGPVKRGRGLAIAIKAVISPTTSVAIVNVNADGSTTLYCGTVDIDRLVVRVSKLALGSPAKLTPASGGPS